MRSFYYPIFQYDVDGTSHQVISTSGSNPAAYDIGESVALRYNPDNPEQFCLDNDKVMNTILRGFSIGGFVAMALGAVLVYFAIVRKRH